jgi:hypothetical protein
MTASKRMTPEEIEARVWAFVIVVLVTILLGAMAMFLYSVTYVTQPMSAMAPIDKVYTAQISTIMVFITGVLGGVAGRSGVKAVAHAIATAEASDDDPPAPPKSGSWTGRPPAPSWVNRTPSPPKAKVEEDDDPPFKGAKE